MTSVLLQTGLRHVLAAALLAHVVLISHRAGVHPANGHVVGRHGVRLRHSRSSLLRRKMAAGRLLGGVDGISVVDTILSAARRLWRVQAGLQQHVSKDPWP